MLYLSDLFFQHKIFRFIYYLMATTIDPKRDVWNAIITEHKNEENEMKEGEHRHYLFVGSQLSGKSTVINLYFSNREVPQPTIAINYHSSYIKHEGNEYSLHFWELGSGTKLEKLIDTIITKDAISNLTIFICFDLERASSLLELNDWIGIVERRFSNKNVETFLLGTRYDIFSKKDPSDKLEVVTALRAMAIRINAGIIFYSNSDSKLIKRFKDVIRKLSTKSEDDHVETVLQHTAPVLFFPGDDNEAGDKEIIIPFIRKLEDMKYKEESNNQAQRYDVYSNDFQEKTIDDTRIQKEKELEDRLRKLRANLR